MSKRQLLATYAYTCRRMRLTGLLGVAVAVMILMTVARPLELGRRLAPFASSTNLRPLVDAVGARRLTVGRLTGGFQFGPREAVRGIGGSTVPFDLAVVTAATTIVKNASGDEHPAALHASGIAHLILHNDDEAISALEAAVAGQPDNADYQSDLAAGYLARSTASGNQLDLAHALDAVEVALAARPSLLEALYNRGAVLEALGLREPVEAARRAYLLADPTSGWADDVRDHLAASRRLTVTCAADPSDDRRFDEQDGADAFVETCPQAARERLDWQELPSWAASVDQEPERARIALARAIHLARAIARTRGDRMPLAGTQIVVRAVQQSHTSSLAAGHRELDAGRRLYDADHRDEAVAPLERASALLRQAASPYWLWAEHYLARIDSHRRRLPEALARLDVIRNRGMTGSFTSLLAREAWLRGLVLFQAANPSAALESYYSAIAYYEQLGEADNAANVSSTAADTQRSVGDLEAGWGILSNALKRVSQVSDPTRRYLICYNASLYCLRFGLTRAALVFQDEAVHHARDRAGIGGTVEALLNRSKIHDRLGHVEDGHRDRAEALSLLSGVTDDQQRRYMLARYEAIDAEVNARNQPQASLANVRRALDYFVVAEPGEVPWLHGIAATAARQLGDNERAASELRVGIDAFRQRRRQLTDEISRAVYFQEGWPLYSDLIGLRIAAGDAWDAFEVAEESKAMTLTDRLSPSAGLPTSASALDPLLPSGISLVVFAQHGDRLHWWRLGYGGFSQGALPMSVSDLTRLVTRARQGLNDYGEDARRRTDDALEQLYVALVEPLALRQVDALVWIPDGCVQDVPFAALKNPRTGHYLVEEMDVSVAPSVRVFITASARLRQAGTNRALIVGDPAFNRDIFHHILPLSGARREAEAVARLYPGARLLLGNDATRRAVLASLPDADIVHIAGHAIGNETVPQMSELLLAPEPDVDTVGALYSYELSGLTIRARVVVLAACQTASGRSRPGEGSLSLARALLGDGAGAVVGTLWDVNDDASRELTVTFHEQLRALGDPVAALCAAERRLLHQYPPQYWAAFQVYGGETARHGKAH